MGHLGHGCNAPDTANPVYFGQSVPAAVHAVSRRLSLVQLKGGNGAALTMSMPSQPAYVLSVPAVEMRQLYYTVNKSI